MRNDACAIAVDAEQNTSSAGQYSGRIVSCSRALRFLFADSACLRCRDQPYVGQAKNTLQDNRFARKLAQIARLDRQAWRSAEYAIVEDGGLLQEKPQ